MRKGILFFILCAISLCAFSCTTIENRTTIGELVRIDGIDVSGMSEMAASETLKSEYAKKLRLMNITVNTDVGDTISFTADKLKFSFEIEKAVAEAMALSEKHTEGSGFREIKCDIKYDESESMAALIELFTPLYKLPCDATAQYDPNLSDFFSFTPSIDGSYVDAKSVSEEIALKANGVKDIEISVETVKIPAKLDSQTLKSKLTLIAEYSTSFSKDELAASGRVANIVKGAKLIDGYKLNAGKEFNINKVLGDRTKENGWSMGYGISDGRYIESYGGGICQVSTTLYNAALLADFEITERHHHTWPMGYTEVGRDATITSGGLNLRFKNTTGSSVVISAIADESNKKLTIRMFGCASEDGTYIEVKSMKTKDLKQESAVYRLNASLPSNTCETYREGRNGCVSETYREYYASDGTFLYRMLISRDIYNPITEIIEMSSDLYYARIWAT